MMKRVVVGTLLLLLLAGCSVASGAHKLQVPAPRSTFSPSLVRPSPPYLGVYAAGMPYSETGLIRFEAATGVKPTMELYYAGFGTQLNRRFTDSVVAGGGMPVLQLNPTGIPLNSITSGSQDDFLRQLATQIRQAGYPVVLSFGPEMNGPWYGWGYKHVEPTWYITAWRHVVSVFRSAATRNVIWMWTANIDRPGSAIDNPLNWYPGASYVTWVGLDGYFRYPSDTFSSVFDRTLGQVLSLSKPVIISETGFAIEPQSGAQVRDLFAGVKAHGLLGFILFDSVSTQDWRVEDDPAALAAFRKAVGS